MDYTFVAVLCVLDIVFAVAVIYWSLTKKNIVNKKEDDVVVNNQKPNENVPVNENVAVEPANLVEVPAVKEPKEELVEIDIPDESAYATEEVEEFDNDESEVEEAEVEEFEETEEIAEPDVIDFSTDDEDSDKLQINRLSFAEKLLMLDDNISDYYNLVYNYFSSFRKINPRVSRACVSFRFGRELVAKLTIRGKTMKLHLALNVNDYDEKIYFQRDDSDVKAYEEVPFTVKIKSERGTRRALELIAALAIEKGIEQKTRYQEIDAMEEIRAKA